MAELPEPTPQNNQHSTSVTNVSGGVNVDAQRDVTIGGDVVGRDKITQNTWTNIRHIIVSPWGLIIGIAILAATALVIALLFLPARQRPIVSPNVVVAGLLILIGLAWLICFFVRVRERDTAIEGDSNDYPFSRKEPYYRESTRRWARLGLVLLSSLGIISVTGYVYLRVRPASSLILVADFEDRSNGKYAGIDPAQYICEKLQAQAQQDKLNVRIERFRQAVDDNTVWAAGEAYNATLVLWGWYDALTITPRIERITTRVDYQSTEEGQHISLADPIAVEFSVVTNLPGQSTYVILFVLGLNAYVNSGEDSDEALAYFTSAIESIPANVAVSTNPAEAYFLRGLVYDNKGDHDRALVDYTRAIQLRPDHAEAYFNRGLIYYNKGDYDRALVDYTRAIQLKPNDGNSLKLDQADAYLSRGLIYYNKGDADRAIADYTQAIELKPDYAGAYLNRGLAYHSKGDYDRAIADYTQAIQLKPNYAGAYTNRGNVFSDQSDYDRAIADYTQAIQFRPDYAEAYFNRGITYDNKGDYDRAIADYTQAIQLKPDDANALKLDDASVYHNRGIAYGQKGDYARAIADYGRSIQLRPDFAGAYLSRGGNYSDVGQYELALQDYAKVIELDPKNPLTYQYRGTTYSKMRSVNEAIADFQTVLELSDDSELRQYAQDQLKALGAQ